MNVPLLLRELENDGLVIRKIFVQMPPKVEYSLTDAGKMLIPLLLNCYTTYNTDEVIISNNQRPSDE